MDIDKIDMIATNDKANFYRSIFTEGAEKWAREYGLNDIRCVVAEEKATGHKSYVLIRDGQFIYDTTNYEQLGVHIDMIALSEGKQRK